MVHDAADTSVGILDERTCITVEVDTLFWVEERSNIEKLADEILSIIKK